VDDSYDVSFLIFPKWRANFRSFGGEAPGRFIYRTLVKIFVSVISVGSLKFRALRNCGAEQKTHFNLQRKACIFFSIFFRSLLLILPHLPLLANSVSYIFHSVVVALGTTVFFLPAPFLDGYIPRLLDAYEVGQNLKCHPFIILYMLVLASGVIGSTQN